MKVLVALGEGQVKDSYFTPKVVEELNKLGEIVYNETGNQGFTHEELMEAIVDVDVLITCWGSPRVDAEVMLKANKLKIHAHAAGSVANLVSKEEYDRGVIVLSGNDVFAQSVAEGCLSYTLNSLRDNEKFLSSMRAGEWRPNDTWNSGLVRKKIGLIGFGAISRYYMDLLRWFEPDLYIASDHMTEEDAKYYNAKLVSKEYIFANCEVISLHSAWNKETEGSITREMLQLIRPGALFVNTARAYIVDRDGLYDELATGRFNAALDVYHVEPLPENDPLRSMKHVQLYPHMAGPTFDMREVVSLNLIEDIKNIMAGKPYKDEISFEYAQRMTVGLKKDHKA